MPTMRLVDRAIVCLCLLLAAGCTRSGNESGDWTVHGRDSASTKFSPLDQINRHNVSRLRPAWVYHYDVKQEGNAATWGAVKFQVTPLLVDGVMYLSTPVPNVVALDPTTGQEIWKWTSPSHIPGRGLAWWPGDGQKRGPRLIFAIAEGLVALDAATGTPAADFRDAGILHIDRDKPETLRARIPNPVAIFEHLAITGSVTGEGGVPGPRGDIRAWDLRTGELAWTFHTIPLPGEPGFETWPDETSVIDRPGANVWSMFSVDTESGTVFAPIGSPGYDFYGGDRKGANLYGNSVVALDARTGKLRWHYQMVRHDIFDYDLAGAPSLIEVKRAGKTIPALVQGTKMGSLYVLDRRTGQPLFDVEERRVPRSDVPGEVAWDTQPVPVKPPPLSRSTMTEADLTTLSPESTEFCRRLLSRFGHVELFKPLGQSPTLSFPGSNGGVNWGGVSFNPGLRMIFVNVSNIGTYGQLTDAPADSGLKYRNEGAFARFVDQNRYPCQRPPWGELVAIDADSGDIAWRATLGSYPELESKGIFNTGAPGLGGSITTAGGLVFIGATNDRRFRAFDAKTGAELWRTDLPATANAVPMTYLGRDGKQYVAVAAGGPGNWRSVGPTAGDGSDTVIAFRLVPDGEPLTANDRWTRKITEQSLASVDASATAERVAHLPADAGLSTVKTMCGACHSVEAALSPMRPRGAWAGVIQEMRSRGAKGSDADAAVVLDYLSRYFATIDINHADAREIEKVLGLTPEQAQALERRRRERGTFRSFQELLSIDGVPATQIAAEQIRIAF